jgi:flagellar biosynthesis protein FlhF
MNIQRFIAATSREALAKARHAFGEGTLILSNRPVSGGIEVVATAEDTLAASLPAQGAAPPPAPVAQGKPSLQSRAAAQSPRDGLSPKAVPAPARNPVHEDTEQLAMSTLSFQDYVRERMLRRRHEALNGDAADQPPQQTAREAADAPLTQMGRWAPAMTQEAEASPMVRRAAPQQSQAAPARESHRAAAHPVPRPEARADLGADDGFDFAPRRAAQAAAAPHNIVDELQSMKDLIEERFNSLAWLGQARQDPIQSNLMLKFIRAGYSPALARALLERMPSNASAADAVRWLMDVLERNIRTAPHGMSLAEEGGIFALVGATGVGKTTTAAKMAAACAQIHGPQSVGLITLDTYRVAAHEQLRAYGRMLGVVAHLAHDRAALQDLLGLLAGKKMVLIDTTGIAPRDPRKRDMLDVLDLPGVQRLLVLNAGSHGDTLDDMVDSFKVGAAQQTILTKTDEAVKLGPALDALIRHQLVLRGVTNGQRVPEDWDEARPDELIRASMRSPARASAHEPRATDLNFFFTQAAPLVSPPAYRSHLDA